MADEYRVVAYSPEHRRAVLDLHGQLLPRPRQVTERYFAWKYEENPYLPEPLFALVFSGDDLVGMRGLCGSQWVHPDGSVEVIPAAEDLIIDPAHRNRGLYMLIDRKLSQMAAERGYRSLLSLSANAATRRLQDITGWKAVAAFGGSVRASLQPEVVIEQPLIRRFRARGASLARRAGLEIPELLGTMKADRILAGIEAASPNIAVSAEPDLAALVSLTDGCSGLRHAHDAEFYRWRLQNPDRRYRYVYWMNGTIRGYLVLAFQPSNPQRVLIVDAGAEAAHILIPLLNAVACATRPSLTALPDALPPHARERLPRIGFVADGDAGATAMVLVFQRTTTRDAVLPDMERWQVPLLDTMLG